MKKLGYFICVLFFYFPSLQGQIIKIYSGPYKGSSTIGKAVYEYYESKEGERILNGSFKYITNDGALTISGQFKANKKNGNWFWNFKNYSPENYFVSSSQFINKQLSGLIIGEYTNGNRTGIWKYKKDVLSEAQASNTQVRAVESMASSVNYRNNLPIGSFSYSTTSSVVSNDILRPGNKSSEDVTGAFDENGFLNGDLTVMKHKSEIPYVDKLKYNSGVLYSWISQDVSTGKRYRYDTCTNAVNHFFSNYDRQTGILIENDKYYCLINKEKNEISIPDVPEIINEIELGSNPFLQKSNSRNISYFEASKVTKAAFYGDRGWAALNNSDYLSSLILSNKALELDSTLFWVKLNVGLTCLILNRPDYLQNYLDAIKLSAGKEDAGKLIQEGINDINTFRNKIKSIDNADKAILVLKNALNN